MDPVADLKQVRIILYSGNWCSCPWGQRLWPKQSFELVWLSPAPVLVPNQRPIVPNVVSVTSVANKGDNKIILRAVHRFPGIYLKSEQNPGKPQLGGRR